MNSEATQGLGSDDAGHGQPEQLMRKLVELRPEPAPVDGPMVSIVITNRDGAEHLHRLLAGLKQRTRYSAIELVLVDNGSSDGSLKLFDRWVGPKQLVRNLTNRSFSAANNQGIRAATGDLVLLVNNDVDPIHPHWLGYMVESLQDDVAAVGALLVYPERPQGHSEPQQPDLTVQHRGMHFDTSRFGVRGVNSGAGEDPLAIRTPRPRAVPAATAACLLARHYDLLRNPLDEEYWYGSEDWDLCLRLAARGKVLVDERAVLFHHEFGTQDKHRSKDWLDRRADNHRWFNRQWGPAVLRKLRLETTSPSFDWFYRGDRVPVVHLTVESAPRREPLVARLRSEFKDAGWEVVEGKPQKCDIAIALDPPDRVQWFLQQDLSVAIVLDREEDWVSDGAVDAAKSVVVPNHVGAARLATRWGADLTTVVPGLEQDDQPVFASILAQCRPSDRAIRIGVSTCAPDWERARFWGETYLARALGRAFRRQGHEATELIRPDWAGRAASSCDVVLHLRGLHRRPLARGQWNLLWIISHPDRLEPGECDNYDLVATASESHAEQLTQELGRKVHFIPQATDADTFATAAYDPEYQDAVLYVGVARRPHRRGPRWLMRSGKDFQLYGRHWEDFPEAPYHRGEHLPNRELPNAYHSSAVVVADHHGSMRTNGFLANRVFDIMAAGGVVLSDDVQGLEGVSDELIPTYATPEELNTQLDLLLSDPARRRHLSTAGRELVLAAHTIDHRARTWLELLDAIPGP